MPCPLFLSYKREDVKKVEKIYRRLANAGFNPWMDRDIPPGKWEAAINDALCKARLVLVFLSSSSRKLGYYHKEIHLALQHAKLNHNARFIVPVLLEKCEILPDLAAFQVFDYSARGGWENLLIHLRNACSPPLRILVVDDDEDFRRLECEKVQKALNQSGRALEIVAVETVTEAEKLLAQSSPWKLLVTDLGFNPEKGNKDPLLGMDLAELAHDKGIKCIAITGNVAVTPEHAYRLGKITNCFFEKIFFMSRIEEFMRAVRELCL